MNKLKAKWGIESNWQLALIFVVFSITGSLTIYVKGIVFTYLGIGSDTSLILMIPLYILTVIPIYYILLLIIGTIFGQFRFFLAFEKKSLGRIFIRRKSV